MDPVPLALPKVKLFRIDPETMVLQASPDRIAAAAGVVLGQLLAAGTPASGVHWACISTGAAGAEAAPAPAAPFPAALITAVSPGSALPDGWYPDCVPQHTLPELTLEAADLPVDLASFLRGFAGMAATDQISAYLLPPGAPTSPDAPAAVEQILGLARAARKQSCIPGYPLDATDEHDIEELSTTLRLTASEQRILQQRLQELRVRSGSYSQRLARLADLSAVNAHSQLPRQTREAILQRVLQALSQDAAADQLQTRPASGAQDSL
ncbi:hypothetical protein [Spirochaeta africana]|uniref:hypothetical protein n=1 Tax=Spirochaeta africana TaxID=46355 RepID=UPI0012EA2EC3|nr:hypothetical protein [Spirochaeta africana]